MTDADFQFDGGSLELWVNTTIDTGAGGAGNAGSIRLNNAPAAQPYTISAVSPGMILTLDASADAAASAGGNITLGRGIADDAAGFLIDSLTFETRIPSAVDLAGRRHWRVIP